MNNNTSCIQTYIGALLLYFHLLCHALNLVMNMGFIYVHLLYFIGFFFLIWASEFYVFFWQHLWICLYMPPFLYHHPRYYSKHFVYCECSPRTKKTKESQRKSSVNALECYTIMKMTIPIKLARHDFFLYQIMYG